METKESIRLFWFGNISDDEQTQKENIKEKSLLWWGKDFHADDEIKKRFETYVIKAVHRELDHWLETAAGRLALILLTDQFTRNIYRNTPKAFEYDRLARNWCKEGIQKGCHQELQPIEQIFFYLPLEHSELLEDQDLSVKLFKELAASIAPEQKSDFDGFYDYAIRHRQVIARFGRFPHRNEILGRESTEEEKNFLKEPNSSF
ncbi:MAG: DUF924 family protein [Pseudomonadota bacterium]